MPYSTKQVLQIAGTLAALCFAVPAAGYNLSGERWSTPTITMHLQLGPSNGTLIDGNSSWGESAEDALAKWNSVLTNVEFRVVRDSTQAKVGGNRVNNVFWSSNVYGDDFDDRTLAVALSWTNANGVRLESDVIFNNAHVWNSYRGVQRSASTGQPIYDFQRVALHEFGHVLGLGHPDDIGQRVSAVMNATVSNTEQLTEDDIAGGRAIYDSGTFVPAGTTLYLQIPASYRISGTTLNLQVARVQSERAVGTVSGSLRLDLWAMPSPFNNGLPTGSRLLGRHSFPEVLASGNGYPNVNVNVAYTAPPNGTYYVAMVLGEFTGGSGSGWTIRDFRQFDTQLTVGSATAPSIVAQPFAQTVRSGATATFSVTATGSAPLTYQWRRDGVPLPGATSASLTVSPALPIHAGRYTVDVLNSVGSASSSVAALNVQYARLINISTRAQVGAAQDLTPGFVMRGSGSKQLIIRGIGPSLTQFGVTGALTDPRLDVIPAGGTNAIASNDNWGGSGALSAAFTSVGAFPLSANSRDAAVQSSLAVNSGGYTVPLRVASGSAIGVALVEVYDADSENSPAQLVNVSTRGFVGTGAGVLTPGFVIKGNASKALLIRAIGPGLSQFGVPAVLADPQLMVVPAGQSTGIAVNDNWGGTARYKSVFATAGAFNLADNSRDAAIVTVLQPGGYTVVVSGVGNTTGNALVEVYDLDP